MRRLAVALPLLIVAAYVFAVANIGARPADAAPSAATLVSDAGTGLPLSSAGVAGSPLPSMPALSASAPPTPSPSPTPSPAPTPTPDPGPVLGALSFDDEFGGTIVKSAWGQHWQPIGGATWARSHATVANGVLTIKATRSGSGWVSSLLDTSSSFGQRYGVFSARIRIPEGTGLWPAFWLAQPPVGSSPKAEVDVMEICANVPGRNGGNDVTLNHNYVHDAGGGVSFNQPYRTSNLAGSWHVYTLDWRRDHMAFYLDGREVSRFTTTADIPSVRMGVILDLAVGSWCGNPDAATPVPSVMQVDWVRVYR